MYDFLTDCVCMCEDLSHLSVWKCVGNTHTSANRMQKVVQAFKSGFGCECVLSMAAINYKALGLHVLIRGINVSSFPSHTPPFASINAEGERREHESEVKKGEREKLPRVSSGGGERKLGDENLC